MTAMILKMFPLAVAIAAYSAPAASEPIKLKLSFFSSDRSQIYTAAVKPFVEAVNADAKGLIRIEVFFSGAMGKTPAQQPQLVTDGTADLAYIIPGYTPDRFPDTAVIEMPGLFRDGREATLVFSRLMAANAFQGYQGYVVIGAFASEPETIHANRPIASLADLTGLKIRANNRSEAAALQKLDIQAEVMPVNLVAGAISSGQLDGSLLPPTMLFEFGVARVASNHFLLSTSVAPLALVMNREKFNGLPAEAQQIIAKYSGDWTATRYNDWSARAATDIIAQLNADARRKVNFPSRPDLERARMAYQSVIDEWAAESPHNRDLLNKTTAEIALLRATR